MDFIDALRVLRRRWLLVLTGALITMLAGGLAITSVDTRYQAGAQYVLLLPAEYTGDEPTNPYINLPGGLVFASTLIASDLGTKAVARSLEEGGFGSDYSIEQGTSGGPVLDVLVEGTDPENVLATRDELLQRLDQELDALQSIRGIPPHQLIFSRTNAVDPAAEVVPGAKMKALVLVAALGVVATLILTFAVDGHLRRRKRARSA